MATYAESVRQLQPVIPPIFSALEKGLKGANEHHTSNGLVRSDDPWHYAHTARRIALEELRSLGLQAETEDGRPLYAMSGLLLFYKTMAVRILRPSDDARTGGVTIPLPGRSKKRQAFWSQDPASAIPGLETDNLLLLWKDDAGKLVDPMTLVRPTGGGHRRNSLRVDWVGKLSRSMATLRAADLDELEPDQQYKQLGD
ncbi:hypothetical protein AB0M97_30600 [Streptomyces sp. NPDC051207]|uniref:hypothetical protein n=1 Tax=Streptomyces sp. NPDC051207 TaxID=3154641 RepID=UPI00341CB010